MTSISGLSRLEAEPTAEPESGPESADDCCSAGAAELSGINLEPVGSTEAVTGLPCSSTTGKRWSALEPISHRTSPVLPKGTASYLSGSTHVSTEAAEVS